MCARLEHLAVFVQLAETDGNVAVDFVRIGELFRLKLLELEGQFLG